MKNFWTIFKFELDNYIKSKGYLIPTLLLAIVASIIMFVPRIKEEVFKPSAKTEKTVDVEDLDKIAIYDANKLSNPEDIKEFLGEKNYVYCDSADEVEKMVKNGDAKFGFDIKSIKEFDYYILNKTLTDSTGAMFTEYMQLLVRHDYCDNNNLNFDEFVSANYAQIQMNEQLLGKDGASGYWYCYALIMVIYMMFILYGVQTATGVTNEKSNRSIEILVTSTSSASLLFGKVMASAVAAIFQVGVILGSTLGSYKLNAEYWPASVANFIDIPASALIAFAIFGIGGFIFYMFIYGALGALVSKIEDLNKSIGSAQMVVMAVFMVCMFSIMGNVDSTLMKVLSFLPFSSYTAMFARVAIGSVEVWEVIVSAIILAVSVVLAGILGGKIFRESTLRYGNPIKLSSAIKSIFSKDNK